MPRWPAVIVFLMLLAGCSGPDPPEAPPENEPSTPPDETPAFLGQRPTEDESFVFYGEKIGFSPPRSDAETGCPAFYGSTSFNVDVEVRAEANLHILLTWNVTAPTYTALVLFPPAGDPILIEQEMGGLGRSLEHLDPQAEAGRWTIGVCAEGPAVIMYKIAVTVDYPGV